MKTILVTGSSGLMGSEAVAFFERRGWLVYGVDNNLRRSFFGPDGECFTLRRSLHTILRATAHLTILKSTQWER
jgi:CDP-paratose 2-epimerase